MEAPCFYFESVVRGTAGLGGRLSAPLGVNFGCHVRVHEAHEPL